MTSLAQALKRKLASILPFYSAGDGVTHELEIEPISGAGDDRSCKRQRLSHADSTPLLVSEKAGSNNLKNSAKCSQQSSALLRLLPRDVLAHCFSYINTPSDFFSLQVTCTTFRDLSNADDMLANIELGGGDAAATSSLYYPFQNNTDNQGNNDEVGALAAGNQILPLGAAGGDDLNIGNEIASGSETPPPPIRGIILDSDNTVKACTKLVKFAAAGNLQAIHM